MAANQAFQLLLLHNLRNLTLEHSLKATTKEAEQSQRLIQRLTRNWNRIQKLSSQFEELDPTARHYLRNQIKRLRYNLEALGYDEKQDLYIYLAKAQDHLGDLCDAYVAQDWYQKQTTNKEQKQFALDWLSKKIDKYDRKSKKTLSSLQAQRFSLCYTELIS